MRLVWGLNKGEEKYDICGAIWSGLAQLDRNTSQSISLGGPFGRGPDRSPQKKFQVSLSVCMTWNCASAIHYWLGPMPLTPGDVAS